MRPGNAPWFGTGEEYPADFAEVAQEVGVLRTR
jgi:hypothetical protein